MDSGSLLIRRFGLPQRCRWLLGQQVAVGITFGPLVFSGSYLVQANTFNLSALLIPLPLGLLITNVLWINQYPDYEADLRGGKRNLLVRFGKKKGLQIYTLLFFSAYLLLVFLAVIFANPLWILPLFSLPLSGNAIKIARKYYEDIPRMVEANLKTVQVYQLPVW
ncbi:MAG: prenyltransferase [Dethiobacteria bacterium]|jgi:1,4-dihydroxy-2-naphthoate octaprenyltransferase